MLPEPRSHSAGKSSTTAEELFLLTKARGISFCTLRQQLWVWVSFTVARSWVVIPAQRCSDKCDWLLLGACSYAYCFTLESQKSRFWQPWLIHIPLYLDLNDALHFQIHFHRCSSNQFHFYVLNSFSSFQSELCLIFKLFKYYYLFSSIYLILLFLVHRKEKNLLAPLQRRALRKELWLFAYKGLSHLQQLIGSINLLSTSLCHTTHQIFFMPQLTLTSRNSSYYMCYCAECWTKHLLFPPCRCLRVQNNSTLWKNSNWSLKHQPVF